MAYRKLGLDQYNIDLSILHDSGFQVVAQKFGSKVYEILLLLLDAICRRGYYAKWSDDEKKLLANRLTRRTSTEKVDEIVMSLAGAGVFDEEMLREHQVLTSMDIQTKYFRATARRVRSRDEKLDFLLIETNGKECQPKETTEDRPVRELQADPSPVKADSVPQNAQQQERQDQAEEKIVKVQHLSIVEERELTNMSIKEKLTQWNGFIRSMLKDEKWIHQLQLFPFADIRFQMGLEKELRRYSQWLITSRTYRKILTIDDFRRHFYAWATNYRKKDSASIHPSSFYPPPDKPASIRAPG
jgi:hypothetical protein